MWEVLVILLFPPFSTFLLGNPRLPVFLERDAREIPDRDELPAPRAAVFADGGAAEPSDAKGGRPEPLRGAVRAGPHRRVTFSPKTHFLTHDCTRPFSVLLRETATACKGSPNLPLI